MQAIITLMCILCSNFQAVAARAMNKIPQTPGLLVAFVIFCSCHVTQRTDLFFGTSIPGGGEVTEMQWQQFNDSIVSTAFPEGYTELDAAGKWLDTKTKKTISEKTKVLSFVGKKSNSREQKLDSVIQFYIKRYQQQAVLRVDTRAKVKFVGR
jgi:hypothetical protein